MKKLGFFLLKGNIFLYHSPLLNFPIAINAYTSPKILSN